MAGNATFNFTMFINSTQDIPQNEASVSMTTLQLLTPICCCFGIVGIILTLTVLSRKNMCTSTNCYLMALTSADLLFLIFLSTSLLHSFIKSHLHSQQLYHYEIATNYVVIFASIFLMASVWMTVMLAIERYIAICRPFLAGKFCTVVKARIVTVAIFGVAFLLRLPNFFEYKIYIHDLNGTGTLVFHHPTPYGNSHFAINVYPWIMDGFLVSIIPCIVLFILNFRLVFEVRKSTQYLHSVTGSSASASNLIRREECQITIMLVIIVIVFYFCQVPYMLVIASKQIHSHMLTDAYLLLREVALLLVTIKSAVNFIVYCWFSEKFWMTLKKICCKNCPCARKARLMNGASHNSSYYQMRTLNTQVPTKDNV